MQIKNEIKANLHSEAERRRPRSSSRKAANGENRPFWWLLGERRPSRTRQGRRITWDLTPDFEPTATESGRRRHRSFPAIACIAVSVAVSTCLLVLGSFFLLDTYRHLPTTAYSRTSEHKVIVKFVGFRPAATSNATPHVTKSSSTTSRKARRAARLHPQKYHQPNFCFLNVSSWSLGPTKHTKDPVLTELEEYCAIFVYCDNAAWNARLQTGQAHRRSVSMLVGLRVGDAAFRSVLKRGTTRFTRNVLRFLENNGYDGIRLWWSGAASYDGRGLVGAARAVGDALRKRHYTFGFFLPYDLPLTDHYLARLARLRKALRGAPYGLLLYPTFPVFRNRTTWPSPAEIAVPWKGPKNDLSLCHIFPQQPVWVTLNEMCDVGKEQRISGLSSPTAAALFDPCRLLAEESWEVTTLRFHSYACKEDKGVLYQNALQADTFRHEFLAETKLPCIGSIGDTIDCEKSVDAFTSL
ncbi:hypothetical protein MRX96_042576 [Rhipicephalus microplus]